MQKNYSMILGAVGVKDCRQVQNYFTNIHTFYTDSGFFLVPNNYAGPRTCALCGVPIRDGHLILAARRGPGPVCWECVEADFLSVEPGVVPPTVLDQFRDTGEH